MMTTIYLTVTGAHAAAQPDGPITSGMVGLPVVISCDESWNGLTKTLVCRNSMGKAALDQVYLLTNIGTRATVAPEVMVAHRHLYLGLEGRDADGTLVIPTVWAHCGMIQPGAESRGSESLEATPEVWAQLASQIGDLEELETGSKEDLVSAVNALSRETQEALTLQSSQVQELETSIQNVHSQLTDDIKALEEEMAHLPDLEITAVSEDSDIPRVFLEGTIPTGTEETQALLTYISKADTFSACLTLSCADDTSANQEKKSLIMNMFFDEDRTMALNKSFRDWGYASSTYVLRSNFTDHSHGRNIVASRLWNEIMAGRADYDSLPLPLQDSPRNGASDGFPVKVYLNGNYQGIYTWNMGIERWNMSESNHGLLRALANSSKSDTSTPCNFRNLWSGTDGDYWAVEVGSGAELAVSLNNLIRFVQESTDEAFRTSLQDHLDLQSAMDYYLFQNIICGVDSLGRNLHLATYDGTKWFCACGDMDATFLLVPDGSMFLPATCLCPNSYWETRSLLWSRLTKLFTQEMKDRYKQLRASTLSFANMCSHFENFMDVIGTEAYQEDVELFPSIPQADVSRVHQIRNAIRDRLAYCDEAIEKLGQEAEIVEAIDYDLNPLANVTWTEGHNYNENGVMSSAFNEHCTDQFTLQNCLYKITYSYGRFPALYVWDQDGNYVGSVANQIIYFTGQSHLRYALRIYQDEGFDPSGISIMPVNNEETAKETITLKLSELTYTTDNYAIISDVHDIFQLDPVSVDAMAAKIHHANTMVIIANTYCAAPIVNLNELLGATFYKSNNRAKFGTRAFGNVLEDAMDYFTEHDTTIYING